MFNIRFGTFIFIFVTFMIWAFNFAPGEVTGSLFGANFILAIFWIVGVAFIISGIKKIVRDKKTDVKGEFCYGKVINVKPNGTIINGVPQYDAYFKVYVESTGNFIEAHENIEGKNELYSLGMFYALKYCEGDINIEYKVPSFDALPQHIKDVFDSGNIIPDEEELSGNNYSFESTYDPNNMYNYDYEK